MCGICIEFNPFVRDWLHPEPAQGADAPASRATEVVLRPGQTITGRLAEGDTDWVELTVTPGERFTVRTGDGHDDPVGDTLLILRDASGRQVAMDDDGGTGFHAEIVHVATARTYYAEVTTYDTYTGATVTAPDTGLYTLTLEGPAADPRRLPTYSTDQIVDYLVDGYWAEDGRSARNYDMRLDRGPEAVIHVDLTGLADDGRWFATRAMETWSVVTGIRFAETPPPGGAPYGIRFEDGGTGAYASTTLDGRGFTANVLINVSQAWISGEARSRDGYAYQTYLHEIGHALGLGHAGAYNTAEGGTFSFADHAHFANDSWQATVMSYFSQAESPGADGSRAYLLTPSVADIAAVERIYGSAGDLRAGNTTYGVGGEGYAELGRFWSEMAFTLVDHGGRDTLDVSDTRKAQTIVLRAEALSDIGGLEGNMSIARGTRIENARSGAGDDRIDGNGGRNLLLAGDGDDTVRGHGGPDRLLGQGGDDRLDGGSARDVLLGHGGQDRLAGAGGNDLLRGGGGRDRLFGGQGDDRLDGERGRDLLHGGPGDDVFVFRPGGGHDVVRDYGAGRDRLDLSAFDLPGRAAAVRLAEQDGRDTVLELGDGTTIVLRDTDAGDLGGGDFLL